MCGIKSWLILYSSGQNILFHLHPDFPEIRMNSLTIHHHLGWKLVWGRYNLTRLLGLIECKWWVMTLMNHETYDTFVHRIISTRGCGCVYVMLGNCRFYLVGSNWKFSLGIMVEVNQIYILYNGYILYTFIYVYCEKHYMFLKMLAQDPNIYSYYKWQVPIATSLP